MYNHFHKYVIENKIIYPQKIDFQVGHLTDHAICQLKFVSSTCELNIWSFWK